MTAVKKSIRLDPNLPCPPEPGSNRAFVTVYTDPTGQLESGVWESTPDKRSVHYTETEFCHILEGEVRLTDEAGHCETYRAGDSFLIEPGFKGTWETVKKIRKFWVIFEPKK